MTHVIADRVKESSTTTGTGALTLAGALTGFQAFSAVCTSPNDTCYYCIQAVDASAAPTGDWEVGLGTYSASNTLTRTTVLASSTGSAISFAAGTKHVWIDLIAASVASLGIEQNSKSAAYTTVASDAGKHIFHPSADTTARVFTIDSNANVPYRVGAAITFINQDSAGIVTIAITSDTMRLAGAGTTGSRTLAANGMATAVKVTSTEWIISGAGLT